MLPLALLADRHPSPAPTQQQSPYMEVAVGLLAALVAAVALAAEPVSQQGPLALETVVRAASPLRKTGEVEPLAAAVVVMVMTQEQQRLALEVFPCTAVRVAVAQQLIARRFRPVAAHPSLAAMVGPEPMTQILLAVGRNPAAAVVALKSVTPALAVMAA